MPARRRLFHQDTFRPGESSGNRGPRRTRRSAKAAMAYGLVSILAAGFTTLGTVVAPADSAKAEPANTEGTAPAEPANAGGTAPAETSEVHRFAPVEGKRAGYSSHISGDYAIYTSSLGNTVDIAHWVGPQADDWEVTTLNAPAEDQNFGASVRLNEDATRAYVVAPTNTSVYVYARSGENTWTLDSALTPGPFPDRVSTYTSFGESIDVQGNHLVVGVPNATVDKKGDVGFAFVVDLATQTWTPLIPETVMVNSIAGTAVAINGNLVAVGAPQYIDPGKVLRTGGLYLWDLGNLTADPAFTVQPDAPRTCTDSGFSGGGAFGMSLGFLGDVLYVGSPLEYGSSGNDPASEVDGCTDSAVVAGNSTQGAVYRFDSELNQIGPKLIPPRYSFSFGYSMAVADGALITNAVREPEGHGEVHAYNVNDLTTGSGDEYGREQIEPAQTLVASDAKYGDVFGQRRYGNVMSVSGDRALIAAPNARSKAGQVYLFEPVLPKAEIALSMKKTEIEYGQRARLEATVSDPTAAGKVTFSVDGVPLPAVEVADGEAVISLGIASHGAGTHSVRATFTSDDEKTTASADSTLTVQKAATMTTLSVPSTAASAEKITLTGKVTAKHGTIPTGTVAVVLDGAKVGQARLDATGMYRWTLTIKKTGKHSLQAAYQGDANHVASATAKPAAVIVKPVTPATTPLLTPTHTPTVSAPSGPADRSQGDRPGNLPRTGTSVFPLAMTAAALLLAGTGALALNRRRRLDRRS